MKISAIVLAYNRQKLLERTLRCLLNQTLSLHEIIVIDNGSLKPLTVPKRVTLLRLDGYSITAAKNAGAAAAKGDRLLFSYDDTFHLPDAVESIKRRVEEIWRDDLLLNVMAVPARLSASVPTESELYYQASTADSEMIRATLGGWRGGLCFEQHCGLINREFFWRIGGYDTQYLKSWGLVDQDLCISVIKAGGIINSDVARVKNGLPLFCFHQVKRGSVTSRQSADTRNAEFRAKHGRDFNGLMILNMIMTNMQHEETHGHTLAQG